MGRLPPKDTLSPIFVAMKRVYQRVRFIVRQNHTHLVREPAALQKANGLLVNDWQEIIFCKNLNKRSTYRCMAKTFTEDGQDVHERDTTRCDCGCIPIQADSIDEKNQHSLRELGLDSLPCLGP